MLLNIIIPKRTQGCRKETAACLRCKCKAGCGHNGCAALGRCSVTKCQKTRKVNWNRSRWHLVNPASGLLQIKSIFNKSPEHLTFWEVDVELSACLSGNIHLILAQLREKNNNFCSFRMSWKYHVWFRFTVWGKAACLNALAPTPTPPLLVFNKHMCYILCCPCISHSRRLAHSLIWRRVGGIKILIEQPETEIHHCRAAQSLWWVSTEQRPENNLRLVSEGGWTVEKQKWVGSLGLAA